MPVAEMAAVGYSNLADVVTTIVAPTGLIQAMLGFRPTKASTLAATVTQSMDIVQKLKLRAE